MKPNYFFRPHGWVGREWSNGGVQAVWCTPYRCRLCRKKVAQHLDGMADDRICPWCCQEVGRKICEGLDEAPSVGFFDGWDEYEAYREERRDHRIVPPSLRTSILKRDGFACNHCGATDRLHIDHKIPSSRGGRLDESNLWVLCASCNISKKDKTVAEWLALGGNRSRSKPSREGASA